MIKTKKELSAYEAQKIAYSVVYAPVVFQVTRSLLNTGVLEIIHLADEKGLSLEEIAQKSNMSLYAVRVMVHAGLGIKLFEQKEGDRYCSTKVCYFLLHDRSVRVTLDFIHDVCYKGLFHLEDSLKNGKPEGLKELGDWSTVYEGLSQLPPNIQQSWFNLDHYYSDVAFPKAIQKILEYDPKRILDIGGNTGKFAKLMAAQSKEIEVTMLDLPGQIEMAKKNMESSEVKDQIKYFGADLLDVSQDLPKDFDIIWMSQFLDCFSEEEIIAILKKAKMAIRPGGKIVIQEGFWDVQKHDTSAFSLQQFSLYFTAIANGNSQMYDLKTFEKCIKKAGLKIEEALHNISISNSLLICVLP